MTDESKIEGRDNGHRYQWVILIALLFIGFIVFGIRFSFGVFFKYLQADFGWSRANTSAIFSAYMVLSAALVIAGGWALDRYGARKSFLVTGLFICLSLLLSSMVTAPWQLFLTYSLLFALGSAPMYVNTMSTISRWFTKGRGLALGIVAAGSSVGMIAISPVAAHLISQYSWRTTYFIISLVAFFVLIPSALLLREPPAPPAASTEEGAGKMNRGGGLSLSEAVRSHSFWLIILILFLFAAASYSVHTHLVPHAIDLGIPPVKAATLLSTIGIGSLLGRLVMGKASDIIGSRWGMFISAVLLGVAMVWLIMSSSLRMLYPFTLAFGFAFGATAPLNAALIGDLFGLRQVGLIMAVIEIGWESGAAVGPALAGYAFDVLGRYFHVFLGGAVAALISAALILMLEKTGIGLQKNT